MRVLLMGALAAIFVVSSLLFLILFVFGYLGAGFGMGAGPETPPPEPASWGVIVGIGATAATSVSSVVGLFMNLRRDNRDARKDDLEARRMELELERTSLELEAMRKGSHSNPPADDAPVS